MNRLLTICLMVFASLSSNCQTQIDTMYFSSKWEQSNSDNYTYYRVYFKDLDGLYICKDYWKDGTLQMSGMYRSFDPQVREGRFTYYSKNGNIREKQTYVNNKIVGEIYLFNSDGSFDFSYCPYQDSLDNAQDVIKAIPKIVKHVKKNLQYPEEAIENRIGCNVETIFYVSPQGEIKRFSAKSCNDETLVAEAKRVLSTFEKWPIALYKGKPTYLYFGMPINFEIR